MINLMKFCILERRWQGLSIIVLIDFKASHGKIAIYIRKGSKIKDYSDGNVVTVSEKLKHKYEPVFAPSMVNLDKKFREDPMVGIKSLEKTYMLKSVAIPEYYLGGNVEFLGEAWKNHRLGLAITAKTYIQNVIPKFEGLFGKEFKPIKTPMSEGYHPEVDDSPLCTEDYSAKYRSIISCFIWILMIVLGRFDIDTDTVLK
jgi:hypothetical protein